MTRVVGWDVTGGARAEDDESEEGRCAEGKGDTVGDRAPSEGAFESNAVRADASERALFFMLLVLVFGSLALPFGSLS